MMEIATDYGPIQCRKIVQGVPIDPTDPPGREDPIRRDPVETGRWRNRPFIMTTVSGFEVFGLIQAVDEPRSWGVFETLDAAVVRALEPRTAWVSVGFTSDELDF